MSTPRPLQSAPLPSGLGSVQVLVRCFVLSPTLFQHVPLHGDQSVQSEYPPSTTIQYNTQYNTIQYYTILYNTILYNNIQCNTMQYNTIYNTIKYITMLYSTMQYNTLQIQYSAVIYSTLLVWKPHHNTLHYTTLHYTTLIIPSLCTHWPNNIMLDGQCQLTKFSKIIFLPKWLKMS